MVDVHQTRRVQPVASSASRSGNPKAMVLLLSVLTVFRVQGREYAGRYVPEDPDATLVEPPFAPRLSKSPLRGRHLDEKSPKPLNCHGVLTPEISACGKCRRFHLMRQFVAIFSSHGVPDSHLMGARSI